MVVWAGGPRALLPWPACCTQVSGMRTPMVRVCTRVRTHHHASVQLGPRGTPGPGSQCACAPARARPGPCPLLTLLLHPTLQALAEPAGLALAPGLPGDFAGALPEGAPQPGVAFHGSPVRTENERPVRGTPGLPVPGCGGGLGGGTVGDGVFQTTRLSGPCCTPHDPECGCRRGCFGTRTRPTEPHGTGELRSTSPKAGAS